ncbi:MAG: CotH kinase family protein [Promethearchaeota archaeon]
MKKNQRSINVAMSNIIEFKNKLPMDQSRKALFVLGFIFCFILSIGICVNILYLPVITSELPRIDINAESEINGDDYVNGTLELTDNSHPSNNVDSNEARIKYRGNVAQYWDKKGYRIELTRPKSLLGMRKDDDWLLLAMYLDFPRMRIKMSLDLWRSLEETNPTAILPDSKYVNLYVNGNYRGLYLLAEKNDRRLFGLDNAQNNVNSSLIFQAKIYTKLKIYQDEKWEQDWPNEDENIEIMDDILYDLIEYIHYAPDKLFFNETTGIYSLFDKLNLIDFYLYNFFILHKDFWHRNYFIVRNTYPSKYFLIPWDFDFSFGQHGWLTFDEDVNDEEDLRKSNYLYDRLINNSEFRKDCKDRWFYLREELWTNNFLLDMLSEFYEQIKDVLEIEMNILYRPKTTWHEPKGWPDKFIYSTEEFDLDKYIDHLFKWTEERLDFCDSYFDEF